MSPSLRLGPTSKPRECVRSGLSEAVPDFALDEMPLYPGPAATRPDECPGHRRPPAAARNHPRLRRSARRATHTFATPSQRLWRLFPPVRGTDRTGSGAGRSAELVDLGNLCQQPLRVRRWLCWPVMALRLVHGSTSSTSRPGPGIDVGPPPRRPGRSPPNPSLGARRRWPPSEPDGQGGSRTRGLRAMVSVTRAPVACGHGSSCRFRRGGAIPLQYGDPNMWWVMTTARRAVSTVQTECPSDPSICRGRASTTPFVARPAR